MALDIETIRTVDEALCEAVEAAPMVEGLSSEELDRYHTYVHAGVRISLHAQEHPDSTIEDLLGQVELGGTMNIDPNPYNLLGLFAGSLAVHKLRGSK